MTFCFEIDREANKKMRKIFSQSLTRFWWDKTWSQWYLKSHQKKETRFVVPCIMFFLMFLQCIYFFLFEWSNRRSIRTKRPEQARLEPQRLCTLTKLTKRCVKFSANHWLAFDATKLDHSDISKAIKRKKLGSCYLALCFSLCFYSAYFFFVWVVEPAQY